MEKRIFIFTDVIGKEVVRREQDSSIINSLPRVGEEVHIDWDFTMISYETDGFVTRIYHDYFQGKVFIFVRMQPLLPPH